MADKEWCREPLAKAAGMNIKVHFLGFSPSQTPPSAIKSSSEKVKMSEKRRLNGIFTDKYDKFSLSPWGQSFKLNWHKACILQDVICSNFNEKLKSKTLKKRRLL